MGFPGGASGKEPTYQCRDLRDMGLISRSGEFPEGGHNNKLQYSFFFFFPLQYPCLENPTDRGAWQAIVHRVAQSKT